MILMKYTVTIFYDDTGQSRLASHQKPSVNYRVVTNIGRSYECYHTRLWGIKFDPSIVQMVSFQFEELWADDLWQQTLRTYITFFLQIE